MKKKRQAKNERVQQFLDDIEDVDEDKAEILQKLRTIVFKRFPKVKEEIKYGGIVFLLGEYFGGGLFVRKDHISFEFVHGAEMDDPREILEGAGKFRRHLKFRSLADIKDKDADFFVKQLVSLADVKNIDAG